MDLINKDSSCDQLLPTSLNASSTPFWRNAWRQARAWANKRLSMLFDCSRTQVREALMRLAAKGIVTVSSRRGWYVVQPSHEEAREAFEARRVIEMGLIRQASPMRESRHCTAAPTPQTGKAGAQRQ